MPVVKVSKRGRERILKGHLWVYRSDVRAVSAVSSGEVVDVQNPQGGFLGRAFYSDSSQIALRLITTKDEVVDEDFWRRKLVEALARRGNLLPATTAYRWVHGEADGIPSLVVDRYGDYLSIQTLTAGTDRLKECFIRLCVELAEPVGIMERSDQKARVLEGLPLIKDVVFGEIPPSVSVHEAGIELRVDLREGQKTGLFLDQRENRVAAGSHAAGKALDVFCYDGGFSLHLAGACQSVLAVDTSTEALARLRVNAEVNGFENIEPVQANGFDVLRELETRGERFDTIVLDPPAFAKNRAAVAPARRGYKDINLRAMKLLRPGGILVTSTCSYHISELTFLDILSAAAADARSRMVLLDKRAQSRDHPILLAMPETHYLKCVILRKL